MCDGDPQLPVSFLEEMEGLEQMRALENGVRIQVVETETQTLRVDTPEDLQRIKGNEMKNVLKPREIARGKAGDTK